MDNIMMFSAVFVTSHIIGYVIYLVSKPEDIPWFYRYEYDWIPFSFLSLTLSTIFYYIK